MNQQQEKVLAAIKAADALPTIPAVAINVLRLAQDPRVSIEKLAEVIEKDPALAAKTLRFANSAYYGTTKPIINLPQALVRIGVRSAKMLALSFSLIGACNKVGAVDYDFSVLWQRSLTTSVAARRIASRSVRQQADACFIAALLADIGCPILARTFPREYRLLERSVTFGQKDLHEIEERLLGIAHPQVSQVVLSSWKLPKTLCDAVAAHHDLTSLSRDSEAFTIAAVVMASSDLADIILRGPSPERLTRLAAAFRTYFSYEARHIEVLLKDLGPEVEQVGHMLEVELPPAEKLYEAAKRQILQLALSKEMDRSDATPAQS